MKVTFRGRVVRVAADAGGATGDDSGGGGGVGPEQPRAAATWAACAAGETTADRKRPTWPRGPPVRAADGGARRGAAGRGSGAVPRPAEPRAEPVANPSGYRPDWVGGGHTRHPALVEAVLDIGGCPAARTSGAGRAQVAAVMRASGGQRRCRSTIAASVSLVSPAWWGASAAVRAGCVPRACGGGPGFLTEARRGPISINSGPARHVSDGGAGHAEHYSAARLPAPAGTRPYRTAGRISGVLPVSTTPSRPASRSKRRYLATVERRMPAWCMTWAQVGRVVSDVQSADRASTHATDMRFACASTRSVAKAGCASTARIHAAWPGAPSSRRGSRPRTHAVWLGARQRVSPACADECAMWWLRQPAARPACHPGMLDWPEDRVVSSAPDQVQRSYRLMAWQPGGRGSQRCSVVYVSARPHIRGPGPPPAGGLSYFRVPPAALSPASYALSGSFVCAVGSGSAAGMPSSRYTSVAR